MSTVDESHEGHSIRHAARHRHNIESAESRLTLTLSLGMSGIAAMIAWQFAITGAFWYSLV